jgi:hypothetical protein
MRKNSGCKITTDNAISLTSLVSTAKGAKLTWSFQNEKKRDDGEGYFTIYRKTGNGKLKKIKVLDFDDDISGFTFKNGKYSYIDNTAVKGKKYTYVVIANYRIYESLGDLHDLDDDGEFTTYKVKSNKKTLTY